MCLCLLVVRNTNNVGVLYNVVSATPDQREEKANFSLLSMMGFSIYLYRISANNKVPQTAKIKKIGNGTPIKNLLSKASVSGCNRYNAYDRVAI